MAPYKNNSWSPALFALVISFTPAYTALGSAGSCSDLKLRIAGGEGNLQDNLKAYDQARGRECGERGNVGQTLKFIERYGPSCNALIANNRSYEILIKPLFERRQQACAGLEKGISELSQACTTYGRATAAAEAAGSSPYNTSNEASTQNALLTRNIETNRNAKEAYQSILQNASSTHEHLERNLNASRTMSTTNDGQFDKDFARKLQAAKRTLAMNLKFADERVRNPKLADSREAMSMDPNAATMRFRNQAEVNAYSTKYVECRAVHRKLDELEQAYQGTIGKQANVMKNEARALRNHAQEKIGLHDRAIAQSEENRNKLGRTEESKDSAEDQQAASVQPEPQPQEKSEEGLRRLNSSELADLNRNADRSRVLQGHAIDYCSSKPAGTCNMTEAIAYAERETNAGKMPANLGPSAAREAVTSPSARLAAGSRASETVANRDNELRAGPVTATRETVTTPKTDRLPAASSPQSSPARQPASEPVPVLDHSGGKTLTARDYQRMDAYKASIGAEIPNRQQYAQEWNNNTAIGEFKAASQSNPLAYQAAINDAYNSLYGTYSNGKGPSVTQDGVIGSRSQAATMHLLSTPEGAAAFEEALRRRGLFR